RRLAPRLFPADAPLQLRERQRRAILPRQHFAVDYRTLDQPRAGGFDLGKPVRDQLFAAGPQEGAALTAYRLRPDAVPLPLDLPLFDGPQFFDGPFQRMGKAERVWPADIGVARVLGHELEHEIGRRLPVAHQAMCDHRGVDAADLRQRPGHQKVRYTDAEFPGDQLVPDEALRVVHLPPGPHQRIALLRFVDLAQGE